MAVTTMKYMVARLIASATIEEMTRYTVQDTQTSEAETHYRVYPLNIPLGTESYPYLAVLQERSVPEALTKDSGNVGDWDADDVTVCCVAKKLAEAMTLAKEARKQLEGWQGTYVEDGEELLQVLETAMTEMKPYWIEELKAYSYELTFKVRCLDL